MFQFFSDFGKELKRSVIKIVGEGMVAYLIPTNISTSASSGFCAFSA